MINTIWLRYMDLEVSLKHKKKFLLQHKDFKTMNITSKKKTSQNCEVFLLVNRICFSEKLLKNI